MASQQCPLCGKNVSINKVDPSTAAIHCDTCGDYNCDLGVFPSLQGKFSDKKWILSALTREAFENGKSITLKANNLQSLLDSASIPDTPVEAMDRILLHVKQKTGGEYGKTVVFDFQKDYPLAFARNSEEFCFLIRTLEGLNLVETNIHGGPYLLKISGWQRIEEIQKNQRDSSQAFVAMCFDEQLKSIWENGFKPALEKTGYHAIRIDIIEYSEKICDKIIAEIRKSGLLVADFTGHRQGVYFEAGFAMGLKIPVIFTCHKDEIKNAHFDTRQYNHIVWENDADLKERLVNRIEATLPLRKKRIIG